jgi:hypothetical protein
VQFGPNCFNYVAGRHWRKSKQCSVKVRGAVGQNKVRGQVLQISLQNLGCITAEKLFTSCLITSKNFLRNSPVLGIGYSVSVSIELVTMLVHR